MFIATVKGNNDMLITNPVHIVTDEFIWAIHTKRCHNLSLGLATKARACKGADQE
jgi:hypothetical protein